MTASPLGNASAGWPTRSGHKLGARPSRRAHLFPQRKASGLLDHARIEVMLLDGVLPPVDARLRRTLGLSQTG